jgi:hypothetical protein
MSLQKRAPNERAIRLRYINGLEKFAKRSIALLKEKEFDLELFKEKVHTNYEIVQKLEAVRLDSQYMIKLKEFVNLILHLSENHSESFEEEKEQLLKESNLLHKEKNKSRYKKDKHSKHKFNDGY